MNLKKTDKIVAVIGVIILIASAAIIAVYFSTEDDVGDPDDKELVFMVEWKEDYGSIEILDKSAGAEAYTDPFSVSEITKGAVITKVTVRLQWEDGNSYGLLIKKGYDTLSATITLYEISNSFEDTIGDGNETIFFSVYDEPIIREIKDPEITTKEQAEQYIYKHEQVKDKNSAVFTPEVTVKVGETFKLFSPIRSLINSLRDNGNSFNLYIDYTYYYPEIPNDDAEEENNPPAETQLTGCVTYSGMITPMGKR